jgi:hypothetical protein
VTKAGVLAKGEKTAGVAPDPGEAVKIEGDCIVIRLAGGKRVDLRTKHKARGVLRFIISQVRKTGEREFNSESVRDAYNVQFPNGTAHKRWMCERFREDLFKGKEREFDLLFETIDKALYRYRLKI